MSEGLTVHLHGLEVFGRHGVLAEETRLGQRFVVDLDIDLVDAVSSRSDDLEQTVDYAALAETVAGIVAGAPVALIERLAGLIAELVLNDHRAAAVTVTVRKPHVAIPHVVSEAAVTLHRTRGST